MAKAVLITGASSGIGRSTAELFRSMGWHVAATMRDPSAEADLVRQGCFCPRLDVSDPESIAAAVQQTADRFGRIDVLINNAGQGPLGPIENSSLDEMRAMFETNVFGLVAVTKAVLPYMRRLGEGRILNVSSMGGEFTTPLAGGYHATKYAVESISDALRFEVAPFGIETIVIQPGPVRTPMAQKAVASFVAKNGDPYETIVNSFGQMTRKQMESNQGSVGPEDVAKVMYKAATTARPRTRYKVGAVAHLMPFIRRRLSDRLWDGMWRQMTKPGKPSQQAQPKRLEGSAA